MTQESSVVSLHKLMNRWHAQPVYKCLSKFGKAHKPYFRFSCTAMEEEVIGTGRSKADAKRIVAKMILEQLATRGYKVPEEFQCFKAIHKLMDDAGLPTHSYVVLVNELCKQFRLDPVEYEIMADPAGDMNSFIVKARIGHVERQAQGPSKRVAQQLAAEQIYRHLRTRLSGTRAFNEDEVMYRAFEKACAPTSDEDSPDERRRKEEEKQVEAARQKSRKKKKKTKKAMRRVDIEETVRMEMDTTSGPRDVADVGPQPCRSVADEGHAAEGNEAAALPEQTVQDHDVAMRFISRTMARLGI